MNRKEYMKQYNKEYRKKNKEKIKQQKQKYYQKNRNEILKYHKEYRERTNREKRLQYAKNYHAKNREKINAKRRLKWKTNHEWRNKLLEKQKAYNKARYPEHKAYLKKYNKRLLSEWKEIIKEKYGEIKCSECGYDKSFTALTFHHINGKKDKKFAPCYLFRLKPTPERIKELDKCIILCANCHFEETWGILPI